MATLLYRLGRLSFRRRRTMALVWAALLVSGALAATALSGPMSSAFTIPGTESQQALDLLEERMPQAAADGASARVVYAAPDGGAVTDPESRQAIEDSVAELADLPHVASVVDPFSAQAVSQDAAVAYATVTYDVTPVDLTEVDREELFAAGEAAERAGLTVEFGGDATVGIPESHGSEVIGLLVAALVLFITFGSMLAAGLPLLTAIVGVGLGVLGIQVASGFIDIGSTTMTLALMLGLAVAIDYALFIVSRYRHELILGRSGEEAAGRAVGTAGSAVVFAGATVVIALSALSVVGIPFLTQMGVAAAATVAIAVVIALTLLPALLGFMSGRVLGRKGRASRDTEGDDTTTSLGERWVRQVVRRPVAVVAACVVGLGVVAVPALDLQLAMPGDGTASPDTTQRQAYDTLAAGFGPGFNGPLLITADLTGTEDPAAATALIQSDLAAVDGVVAATPPTVNEAGDTAILTVIPESGPQDAQTEDLVRAIRDRAAGWSAQTGAQVFVTGATAVAIDVSSKLSDAFVPYLLVVIGLAFVLLTLVFRSLLVPLKATVGFLLSIAAAFGALVAVFQWGWFAEALGLSATGPILSFLPILIIGVLFGLAMDYEVFLVSRMREEHVHGAPARDAVVRGFSHGARVVTAAGIIMLSVFAGFVTSSESIVKSVGFALAIGVAIDAFVVRMTLVPAVMALMGDRAWWLPRWLDKVLPDVDVEGEKLTHLLATAPADEPVHLDAAPQLTR